MNQRNERYAFSYLLAQLANKFAEEAPLVLEHSIRIPLREEQQQAHLKSEKICSRVLPSGYMWATCLKIAYRKGIGHPHENSLVLQAPIYVVDSTGGTLDQTTRLADLFQDVGTQEHVEDLLEDLQNYPVSLTLNKLDTLFPEESTETFHLWGFQRDLMLEQSRLECRFNLSPVVSMINQED